MGCAATLGVFGALAGLVSLGAITPGGRWITSSRPGWFGGHWWWVAVTAGAGVVAGVLRRLTRLPDEVPGMFDDLRAERLDASLVRGTMAVSAVSLIGGASVGPEKVLASMGAGAGSWMARRRGLGEEDSQVSALAGIAGIFGGLFSSPVIVAMLILEIARPGGQRLSKILVTDITAGSISFGIYFAIAGAVFLGAYHVPPYPFEDWHLLADVALGLFGALVAVLAAGFTTAASRLFGGLEIPAVAKSALGGMMYGIVGVTLPLTMSSGGSQLASVLNGARTLGLGLRAATLSCLLPAVLGSLAAAPFAMVLMAAFLTRVGALQTAPILIAVVTAFLGVEGVKYLLASRGPRRSQPGP